MTRVARTAVWIEGQELESCFAAVGGMLTCGPCSLTYAPRSLILRTGAFTTRSPGLSCCFRHSDAQPAAALSRDRDDEPEGAASAVRSDAALAGVPLGGLRSTSRRRSSYRGLSTWRARLRRI